MCVVERSCSEIGITSVPSVTFKNRNGGIPIFTQERIEERQRKVSISVLVLFIMWSVQQKNGSSSSIALETSLQQVTI